MKTLLLIPLLLISVCAGARRQVTVATGDVTTAPGLGGDAQIGYAFAKGDIISIHATAEKKLERMIVLVHPNMELGRDMSTKKPYYQFTMPKDGIAIFRFIADRGGTTKVNYKVTRMPATDAVQNYDTRVVWEPPAGGVPGNLVPRRAAE